MKHNIFLLMMIMVLSCTDKKENVPEINNDANDAVVTLSEAQMKNAGIHTGKMEQRDIASSLQLNGKIDVPPQNMVSISVPLGGYLKSTKLLPGMHVNKGEVIAVVQGQQYVQLQQDYLTAKAKSAFLENDYQRQKDLNQSQASSDKVYQLAEANYQEQQVLISALAEKLHLAGINTNKLYAGNISGDVNIYSPITGFVSKVNVNIGKYVSPTEVLFELINPSDIHLNLQVFEKDLDMLFIGQSVMAYTNNAPEKKYPCEIILIGKDLSPERSTEVHCHFESLDHGLAPGTYMNAEIAVKRKRSWVLPVDAIVRFEGKQYVYREMGNQQFEMTEITTGETDNDVTEVIFPGNKEMSKEVFVINGAYSLLMKMKNKAE